MRFTCNKITVLSLVTIALLFATRDAAFAQGNLFHAAPASGGSPWLSGWTSWIFIQQAAFYRSLSGLIRDSKESGSAVWSLFGVSFLYGIFHAAGPGHGKAVISSYLVANRETWRRGVTLSFAAAALQSIVATIVVAIAAILLGATARSIGLTVRVIEIACYGTIILIGLRLVWVKGRSFAIAWRQQNARQLQSEPLLVAPKLAFAAMSRAGASTFHCARCEEAGFQCHDADAHEPHASAWGHAHGPEPEQLAGAGGWRRGLSAVIAVGLRPCSGAIIVLIFALTQDLFWTGVGATLVMGLGTAITVAAIATLAVAARHTASRLAAMKSGGGMLLMRGIEVGASVLIIAFGALLLTGYLASEQLWMFTR